MPKKNESAPVLNHRNNDKCMQGPNYMGLIYRMAGAPSAQPKLTPKLQGAPLTSTPKVEKPKDGKMGLKAARKVMDSGQGYQYQTPYTWSDWQKAVDGADQVKAAKIFRILKAQETRPVHQNKSTECKQTLGLLLASKNIEVSI